ncbi:4-hydroxybutyrate CoA-transferase [bacterium]|nr:4-hydroxybutyrate CoA-transferase [bacterium]
MFSLKEILSLFKPTDTLAVPLASGQPLALLEALAERSDWEHLEIFCGLLLNPHPILLNPKVFIKSGFYGPIERLMNAQGMHMEYIPLSFTGIEDYAIKTKPRVVAAVLSQPDSEGFCTFGTHGAAVYRPFIEALDDPKRIAIAEINATMPVVYGDSLHGDNKVHISKLKYSYEVNYPQPQMSTFSVSPEDEAIAEHVVKLVEEGDTLQFGIGAIPNLIAEKLAQSSKGNFGIHSELVSDGFLKLCKAGKITNHSKGIFPNRSVFAFAFGSQELYDFLDERNGHNKRSSVCLPVSVVNEPYLMAQNQHMVSINSGLMIDFAGQVCSEAIGLKQYSGVGGQLSFVQGANQARHGKSIICLKSTANLDGKLISNIYPTLPQGSLISTPRHYTQYIVTEYGVANLYGVSDEKRAEKLIAIAHPGFKESLRAKWEKIKIQYYKN